ncbi:MAG: globin [Rhizomicrobium sp.]
MTATDDATLIERTLERMAEATDDITPQVYEAFFSMRPDAKELFGATFDMGRGRMLNDVFMTLLDQANGKTYLDYTLQSYVGDHDSIGVKSMSMYKDFLAALRTTISDVLGSSWPQDEKEAFNRHCDLMNVHLLRAEQILIDTNVISKKR